ncbi:MAG: CoA-binding protein [Bacteroidetes bacterium]|nr:CoA-binding protein [Bacteroidota bacterium]
MKHDKKKTLVLGASPDTTRYANMCVRRLASMDIPVVPFGINKGEIEGIEILNSPNGEMDIHTITLYLGPQNQPQYYDYIFSLNPKRIIFNPGTENLELEEMANEKGIETVTACTLTMLAIGGF